MTNKIVSVCIIFSLLLSLLAVPTAMAEEIKLSDVAEHAGLLQVLGVLDDIPEAIEGNQAITRAEFSVLIAKALGMNDSHVSGRYFIDIANDHWAVNYVNGLAERNIISLPENRIFRPYDKITVNEAVKMVLSACGYASFAEEIKGGYPLGYASIAKRLKLSQYGGENELLLYEALELVYDALLVPVYKVGSVTETLTKHYSDEDNLLSDVFDVYIAQGLVTQASGLALNDISEGGDNAETARIVVIDGRKYYSDISFYDYIGRNTTAFYRQADKNDDAEIIYRISDSGREKVIDINIEDFEKYESGKIYYYENNKKEDAVIPAGAVIVKNGTVESENTSESFKLTKGTIRLIDNDGNSKYDYVLISEYKNIVADVISARENIVYDSVVKSRKVSLDDDERIVIIEDAKGNIRKFDNIAQGQVLSVYESEGYVRAVINESQNTGNIYSLSERNGEKIVYIGKNEDDEAPYKIDDDYYNDYFLSAQKSGVSNIEPGSAVTYYQDVAGNIAYMVFGTADPDWLFGYLIDNDIDNTGFNNVLKLQIYTQNNEIGEYKVSDKVKIDGERKKTVAEMRNSLDKVLMLGKTLEAHEDSINGQLIRFKANSDNEIVAVDTANYIEGKEDRVSLHKTADEAAVRYWYWVNGFSNGVCLYDKNTIKFIVPSYENLPDADIYDFGLYSGSFDDETYYDIEGYRLNLDNGRDDAIVINNGENAYKEQGPYLVSMVKEVINASGENVKQAVVYDVVTGDSLTLTARDDFDFKAIDGDGNSINYYIEEGDLFVPTIDGSGNVIKAELIYDYSRKDDPSYSVSTGFKSGNLTAPGQNSSDTLTYTYIKSIADDVIRLQYSRALTDNDFTDENRFKCDWPTSLTAGCILIYDGKSVEKGKTTDIIPVEVSGVADAQLYWVNINFARVNGVIVYK